MNNPGNRNKNRRRYYNRGRGRNQANGNKYEARGTENQTSQISSRVSKVNVYNISEDIYKRMPEIVISSFRIASLPVTYPITTRGFGFLLALYFQNFKLTYLPIYKELGEDKLIHVCYRVTLLQLETQLTKCRGLNKLRYLSFDDIEKMPDENFFLIASIQGIIGDFSEFGVEFQPVLIDTRTPFNQGQEIIYDTNNYPDPFTVSIRNLRSIVKFLEDPNPAYENGRKFFYNNNPIPNAKWNESNYVLQNASDIMPANFCKIDDFIIFIRFMNEMKRRIYRFDSIIIGRCTFDGKGDASVLANVKLEEDTGLSADTSQIFQKFQITQFITSRYELNSKQMLTGFVALVGERPPYNDESDDWRIRSSIVTCRRIFRVDWMQMVNLAT